MGWSRPCDLGPHGESQGFGYGRFLDYPKIKKNKKKKVGVLPTTYLGLPLGTSHPGFGKGWKKDSIKDLFHGRDNTSRKVKDLL